MTLNSTVAFFAAVVLAGTAPAMANDSTYTDLDTRNCQEISASDGGVSMKCAGLDGYPVYFKEGDVRQTVFFGPIRSAYIEGAFESFGPFNHTGEKIEWRTDADGTPVAAILRYIIENADPDTGMPAKALYGQVLVVSHVAEDGDGRGCVAAYVDALANPDANTLARQVADDVAPGFACGRDEPVYHGRRGDKAGEPSRYLPE